MATRGPKRSIVLEGLFEDAVLGIFRIIRGFADLRDLAQISVPYKMSQGEGLRVEGHQRQESQKHAEDIKKYLERSANRFLPEVILSIRVPLRLITSRGEFDEDQLSIVEPVLGVKSLALGPIEVSRKGRQKLHRIRIKNSARQIIKDQKLIRRIDGNHRLHLAEQLEDDPQTPTKYLAAFSLILLNGPDEKADDFSESLIFHTINSTGLPLESEHALRLLLGQDPEHQLTPEEEFAYSPELHLTRLLSDKLRGMPESARKHFGSRPLTSLWESAKSLIAMDPGIIADLSRVNAFATELFSALTDIAPLLAYNDPSLAQTYGFLELAARIWREADGTNDAAKIRFTVEKLNKISKWLGAQGVAQLFGPLSPAEQLLRTFDSAMAKVPKRVFLARWYPDTAKGASASDEQKAKFRLQQLEATLRDLKNNYSVALELIDMGTRKGGTLPIHERMYEAIASSDIIICDLTGQRPNVFVEAGYALRHHETDRLIFIFEPRDENDKVPFDLTGFTLIEISQAAEIPDAVQPNILRIIKSAAGDGH